MKVTALLASCALACGRLAPDGDAGADGAVVDASFEAASFDGADADEHVEICGAYDSDSGGVGYGSCPPGWHCETRKVVDTVWNLCCPPGQNGDSDQCINPQN